MKQKIKDTLFVLAVFAAIAYVVIATLGRLKAIAAQDVTFYCDGRVTVDEGGQVIRCTARDGAE